jgi:hypothetical protein
VGTYQKSRQDYVGLGWANRDHQAYRCSREQYNRYMDILKLLGLRRREIFHAGDKAFWGAQVMEQTELGFVVFADVDLEPDDMESEFATKGLEPLDHMGTIGLWVGLHGESMLQAGIHHLAIRVALDRSVQDLDSKGYPSMPPFSSLDFLKQAFTVAQPWTMDEPRARYLKSKGFIDEEIFDRFGEKGAVGSHMELTERVFGFKGFNQDSVSQIIADTDPRL